MDEKKYVIEVSHVNKNFKDNKVLKDVSLRCESGKIYGLVGHNGSGKTVLFKIICVDTLFRLGKHLRYQRSLFGTPLGSFK